MGVKPDSTLLESLSPSLVGIPLRSFDLPAEADSVLAWRREWPAGAPVTESLVFDNFPLLHLDGEVLLNGNGLPVTFTGVFLVFLRLEVVDTAEAAAGAVTVQAVAFPGDVSVSLGTGDFLIGELGAVNAVTGASSLALGCTGMENKRLSLLVVGVETLDNEEVYPS